MVHPGERGTFTAEKEYCGGTGRSRTCGWKGDWASDDGTRTLRDVWLRGDDVRVDDPGQRVDARDSGSPTGVYADRFIGQTLGSIVFILGAAALLVFCARIIWRLHKEQQRLRVNRQRARRGEGTRGENVP
ncbi:hypothetical protein [Actinomadura sp. 6N118]|uniref:hypothetical protein n=1 Tax=Actinomadura sp. 6N118 TaxID=3375151 RepID=UPI0037BCC023